MGGRVTPRKKREGGGGRELKSHSGKEEHFLLLSLSQSELLRSHKVRLLLLGGVTQDFGLIEKRVRNPGLFFEKKKRCIFFSSSSSLSLQ